MDFINYTPFTPMTFEFVDLADDPFQAVVLKATFKIEADTALVPLPDQQPIVDSDVFYGQPHQSSVRFANDLAPFKSCADIIINATAYPPGGKPNTHWAVSAQVGDIHKALAVTGPRYWRHHLLRGWTISDPELCEKVPIRYEHAYGGSWEAGKHSGVCDQNPVGVGHVNPKRINISEPVPAPRIMNPDDPIFKIGKPHRPEGFSVINCSWQPRLAHAGTYDDKWQKERHPKRPLDFNSAYYNCAHPDLILDDYLQGDEKIVLQHLHPTHEKLCFFLPGYRIACAITDQAGFRYGALANLDTLHLEVDEMQALLVWRITLPLLEDGIEKIETRMIRSDDSTLRKSRRTPNPALSMARGK